MPWRCILQENMGSYNLAIVDSTDYGAAEPLFTDQFYADLKLLMHKVYPMPHGCAGASDMSHALPLWCCTRCASVTMLPLEGQSAGHLAAPLPLNAQEHSVLVLNVDSPSWNADTVIQVHCVSAAPCIEAVLYTTATLWGGGGAGVVLAGSCSPGAAGC